MARVYVFADEGGDLVFKRGVGILLRPELAPGFHPSPGDPVAIHATYAAIGSWVAYAPTDGFPAFGLAVSDETGPGVKVFKL